MATPYISEPAKSERLSEKTDHSLIETVQERSRLLKTGADERNPAICLGNRAFSELLKRYNNWIWKQINAFTGLDLNEAYSAALEGFEKAIAKFDLGHGYALATFASVVVRRAIQLLVRREQRQTEKVELAAAVAPLYHEDSSFDPFEEEQHEQQIEALSSEVKQLKPTRQKIVEMRESGMSFKEIGTVFCKTAAAVRMIFNRAIARLQKRLQPHPQIQPQSALQTAEVIEPIATPSAPIAEVENSTVLEPIPKQGWMGRLRSRFCKSVRFLKSSAISNSSTISSINSCGRLDSTDELPKRLDPTLDPSSTKSSPCSSLLIDERMFCPGSQVSDPVTGRLIP